MKKTILIIIAVAIVVGGVSFYAGMKYAESPASAVRQQRFAQIGGTGGADAGGAGFRGGRMMNQTGASFAVGDIISKDDKSVTVKLRDARQPDGQGGSKIIFFSGSTEISKSASGSASDLEIGKSISVNGTANPDGSIIAQSIQLRPALVLTGIPDR